MKFKNSSWLSRLGVWDLSLWRRDQNQTWHHSCWCVSDWANGITIISILCSILFLLLPNSLFAFFPGSSCTFSSGNGCVSPVPFLKSALVWPYESVWVVSCVYIDPGVVLTTHLINFSYCQGFTENLHVCSCAVSTDVPYAGINGKPWALLSSVLLL